MDINFFEVDSGKILNNVLSQLEQGVSEPLYPGDERRIFGEALAMVINAQIQTVNDGCRQRLLRYARGEVLDGLGENRGVTRIQPTPAETILQFSVEKPLKRNVIIPAGVRVTGSDNLFFRTTKTVVLQAGSLSVNSHAESIEGGTDYNNLEAGALNVVVDKSEIPQIEKVTNLIATDGGGDIEDDETFRERIRTAENSVSCGTELSYKYWTLSANSRIVDAAISTGIQHITKTLKPDEDGQVLQTLIGLIAGTLKIDGEYENLVINGEMISFATEEETIDIRYEIKKDGVVTVMPILAGGELPTDDVLKDVKDVLYRPDVKPLTDYVEVLAPDPISYDIEVEYWTSVLDEAEIVQSVEKSDGAIADYVFWQDSAIGQDINPDQLAKRILCPHDGSPGAIRVSVIKPQYTELKKTEVAKWSGNLKASHHIRR